jgi:hypothetical protein
METRLPSKFVHMAFAAAIFGLLSGTAGAQAQSWDIIGNKGTNPTKPNFLGTTDPQPLAIWTANAERVRVDTNGNVGIGITNPRAKLDIFSGFDTNALVFGRSAGDYHSISTSFHGEKPRYNYLGFNVEYNSNDIRRVLTLVGDGTVGIGTAGPGSMLEVLSTSGKAGISGIAPGVAIYAHNTASGHDAYLGSGCCAGDFYGDIYVHGHTTTQVLEMTGGSDLAEPFAMDNQAAIEPGLVVTIDPVHPGQLRLAEHAYDRTVAGIVSGANGHQARSDHDL